MTNIDSDVIMKPNWLDKLYNTYMDKTPSSVIIVVPPGKHSSIIKKLKELNEELKKDGMAALPEVEKRLAFRWNHAVRLLKVVDSPLLQDKEIRNRLPKEVGTLLEITRMNKSILGKALKTKHIKI